MRQSFVILPALILAALIFAALAAPQPLAAQDQTAPSVPQVVAPAAPALVEGEAAAQPPVAPDAQAQAAQPLGTPAAPPVQVTPAAPAGQPAPLAVHDLTPMGMYEQAHWVVKAVMLSLLWACFVTWTVWLYKTVELWQAKRALRQSHRLLHAGASLTDAAQSLAQRRDPVAVMTRAVAEELERSAGALDAAGDVGIKERAASLVARIEAQAQACIRRGTGFLATIGSTAPFVGLFGTVWGIMNSFIGIAETKTTNLAVVAPGIAEALLATAIGLVAAIPAVVIYNFFARSIAGYRQGLGDAGAAVLRHLSRDLDYRKV